jgi:pimeloyl-ACP methyl ester carboxylesterase
MTHPRKLQPFTLPLVVEGTPVEIAGLHRDGTGEPLVFLHGFGSTKEDYADVIHQHDLTDRPVLAYDAPGCGASTCPDLSKLSIPFLVSVASEVLAAHRIERYHLIGHSMGGLTALVLADQNPQAVESFVNIEGNVAPEDCFLSRQVVSHPHDDPGQFLAEFAYRVGTSRYYARSLYAVSLSHKVRAAAVQPIFQSMVVLSDTGDLFDRFIALPARKLFMYGEQNNSLTYLPELDRNGVELAEISDCAHFPMYSNAPEMWRRITRFVNGPASLTDA